ncbi:hypothetical protein HK405_000669, partial [Cladochytrium tenue]
RSLGVANVLFESKVEAERAYLWCTNLTIDGIPIQANLYEQPVTQRRRRAAARPTSTATAAAASAPSSSRAPRRAAAPAPAPAPPKQTRQQQQQPKSVFSRLGPEHVLKRLGSKEGQLAPGLASRLGPAGGIQARLGPARGSQPARKQAPPAVAT